MTKKDQNKTPWYRDITVFLSAQTLTLLGSSLVQYAITWYITLTTGSGIMMTLSIIAGFLPSFLISPFGGVIADKFNKKWTIIIADILIAVTTLILAVLMFIGIDSIWLIFFILVIRSLGTGVQGPTVNALIPELVPTDKLTKVNGVNGSIQSAIWLISPAVAGVLLSISSLKYVLLIDVFTAIIANLLLFAFLKYTMPKLNKPMQDMLFEMKSGLKYIRSHKYIKTFFIFCTFFFFLVSPSAFLTQLLVTRNYGAEVWRLTVTEMSFSVGMIFGGFLSYNKIFAKYKIKTMVVATAFISLFSIFLGLVSNFYLLMIIMGLFGITIPLFNIPSTVILQETVEQEYMGRVFSVMGMISNSAMPLAMLIFGPIADITSINYLLVGTGAILLLVCWIMYPRLIKAYR
jgi:DHA3 family macrolide efflux protein-like MFS transporter